MRTWIAATTAVAAAAVANGEPIELTDFAALPKPAPTTVVAYGSAAVQAIDVFVPSTRGPHPVAILVHGGCWRDLPGAGREQLRPIAAELQRQGMAVWSVGYRRADEAGGGYPGTFEDIATAVDRVRDEARRFQLDLSRTVIVGHSAGGHLALWASVRAQLPESSRLHRKQPFVAGAVISLAGVTDLKAFARFVPVLCGPGIIERLASTDAASPFAETSPAELPPPSGGAVLISGIVDRLIPPYLAYDYARAMERRHGAVLELVDIPRAGHFDLVTPGTDAWRIVSERIRAALRMADQEKRTMTSS